MAIEINNTRMTLIVNDTVIAKAARVDGVWHVSTWPTPFTLAAADGSGTFVPVFG